MYDLFFCPKINILYCIFLKGCDFLGKKILAKFRRNKWLIALAASGIHISIGSVYAWSVLVLPIMEATGWTLSSVTFTFSLAILFLGLSAGFFGNFVEKYGVTKTGLISTAFFCIGLVGTALALSIHNIYLLYLFYGVIGGIGLGIGYITPVSTLVKYFPENKGFATGLAIMSFGFASLIAAPLMQYLVATYDLTANFLILGFAYAFIMTISSLYLAPPKKSKNEEITDISIEPKEVYATWQFKALWIIFFINITCGIALLSIVSPMAQEVVGMTPEQGAGLVGLIGMVNGFGRIFWSTLSDYIGRGYAYITFFLIEIGLFILLAGATNQFIFTATVMIIVSCYGGGFSCMPAYLSDLFGSKHLSTIHGRILTAWGFAGLAGPLMISLGKEYLNNYSLILYCFVVLFVLSLIVAITLKKQSFQLEEEQDDE